jgi:hypothetical protein
MGLVLSLIEDGTVTINKWHKHTGDKVIYNGNYYSEKHLAWALQPCHSLLSGECSCEFMTMIRSGYLQG